jgi:fatty acid synthase
LDSIVRGSLLVDRWDGCFIRLLDGMLQAGALIDPVKSDFELRIPTKIQHLVVKMPGPTLPVGSEGSALASCLPSVLRW